MSFAFYLQEKNDDEYVFVIQRDNTTHKLTIKGDIDRNLLNFLNYNPPKLYDLDVSTSLFSKYGLSMVDIQRLYDHVLRGVPMNIPNQEDRESNVAFFYKGTDGQLENFEPGLFLTLLMPVTSKQYIHYERKTPAIVESLVELWRMGEGIQFATVFSVLRREVEDWEICYYTPRYCLSRKVPNKEHPAVLAIMQIETHCRIIDGWVYLRANYAIPPYFGYYPLQFEVYHDPSFKYIYKVRL